MSIASCRPDAQHQAHEDPLDGRRFQGCSDDFQLAGKLNLAAAVVALAVLMVAAEPEDADHAFGHDKAEYFSSAFEGLLTLIAAGAIL